jgi:hypothetical protein
MKIIVNVFSFMIMVILARLWIQFDQDILPQSLLMPGFLVVIFALMTGYFFIVRPSNVKKFSLLLSIGICGVAVVMTIAQHVVIQHDFISLWKKSVVIWLVTLIVPNLAGFAYSRIVGRGV